MDIPDFQLELRKFVAPEFVFGVGARNLTGNYVRNLGAKKVLLVTDQGLIKAGWVDELVELFKNEHIKYCIFSQVTPNPRTGEVSLGAEFYNKEKCDLIVAIGGGSPMDCAKGIGILVNNGGKIEDYEGVDAVPEPVPPLIFIPTTAGTAAEVSQFAIILDPKRKLKFAIISKTIVPDVALIDPEVTTTMDPYLTACTGMDALTHAIEAYVSNASSPITDLHAIEAVRLIGKYLVKTIENPDNLNLRSVMLLGSLEAGLAFSNASLGIVHAMAHSLGGLLDLPHGECNAVLLEHSIRCNFQFTPGKHKKIASKLDIKIADKKDHIIMNELIEKIKDLKISSGISTCLKKMGLEKDKLTLLAKYAYNDPCILTNPFNPDVKEIMSIYEQAV